MGGTAARSSRTNLRDIENVVDECQDLGGALLDHRDLLHTTCLSLLVQHLTHAQDTCIDENMRERERERVTSGTVLESANVPVN